MEGAGFEQGLNWMMEVHREAIDAVDSDPLLLDLLYCICVDGDTTLLSLGDHPKIHSVYRDVAHLVKNIYKAIVDPPHSVRFMYI